MIKKKFLLLLILMLFAVSSSATPSYAQLPNEIRGVWVATVSNIDFPSRSGLDADALKRELDDIVKTVADAGLNAIFFQVRPTCDALYNSRIFPTSKWLVKQPGAPLPNGFDPLAYLISIARLRGIAIHAWINPLRITYTERKSFASQVAQDSPAVKHPNWVVAYNGKHYFDAGLPEVRELIANGVKEIVQNYDVAGIIFDDYFYPTPVKSMNFDDNKTFATYGAGFTNRNDWRRDNINKMIKQCYEAVKSVRSDCLFGVSPAGIWQNKKDDPRGSDTNGGNAYRNLCCDALAWMKGGYVDYISPQIYWNFAQKNARYDTLCRWWNANCDATGIPLVVSHATYKVAQWQSAREIANQVIFARQLRQYAGSIFYSYKNLKQNVLGTSDVIRKIMQQNYTRPVTYNNDFIISSPRNNLVIHEGGVIIMGQSNLDSPLFFAGCPVSRTKSGFFCLYAPLTRGNNMLRFQQGARVITRKVMCSARRSAHSSARSVPAASQKSQPCTIQSQKKAQKISIPVEIIKSEARLRPSPNSSRNDDFLPAISGMRDIAIDENRMQYRLRMGAFVAKEDVKVIAEAVPISSLTSVGIEVRGDRTNLQLTRNISSPIDARLIDNEFVITLFNTDTALTEIQLPQNPFFASAKISRHNDSVKLHFQLKDAKNFYGFDVQRLEDATQISLRNPSALAQGSKPLSGKTIVLDAGHGGEQPGAIGPTEVQNEEHLNLLFVLCLKEKLENLGAKVVLTRDRDVTFEILARENFVKSLSADMSISIHYNALSDKKISEKSGFLALYKNPAGKCLAETITDRIVTDSFIRYSPPKNQRLAMCRFYSFPSVLLELGYITCPEDVELAWTDEERNSLCTSIANAVLDFYKKQEQFL